MLNILGFICLIPDGVLFPIFYIPNPTLDMITKPAYLLLTGCLSSCKKNLLTEERSLLILEQVIDTEHTSPFVVVLASNRETYTLKGKTRANSKKLVSQIVGLLCISVDTVL